MEKVSNMLNDTLRKKLVTHHIYSAWQFIEYTEKNIATVQYCADTIKNVIDKMDIKTVRWQQDIAADFVYEDTEDGKSVKRLSVTAENAPIYEVRVAGAKIDSFFLFDKLLRDFFQYTMNTFDSISQIINAGILANKGKRIDSVDIQSMIKCFNQQTYSADFPKMQAWLNKVSQSAEFQYIEAINNRTKHTGDIANKLSMGILGSSNEAKIGPFFRKKVQHEQNELSDQLLATLDFLNDSWDEFQSVFKEEFERDVYTQNRRHGISGVRQQMLKNKPDQNFSYAYIEVMDSFDAMPDELSILLVSERDDEIYAHVCPFDTILITGSSNIDVLGRYIAEDGIGDDCLLHYRKYRKDTKVKGSICIHYAQLEKTSFYRVNPYFNIESFSDDDAFLARVSLPV